MKKFFKWFGIILGAVVLVIVVAGVALFLIGNKKLSAGAYDEIQGDPVDVLTDEAALARGQHIVENTSLCIDCHGENLGGAIFEEDPGFMVVYAPNLTDGEGGVGGDYAAADWERALRHGVGIDGRGLALMPSVSYAFMSDEDLGALIAYIQSLPPVDNEIPTREFGPPLILLTGAGQFPLMPDLIDHDMEPAASPMGTTAEYGEYLVNIGGCRDCHGWELTGQTDPNAPQGPDISPPSEVGEWTAEDFITAMRTGTTPTGRVLSTEMPWQGYAGMTDEELQAIYLYLQSIPPAGEGGE